MTSYVTSVYIIIFFFVVYTSRSLTVYWSHYMTSVSIWIVFSGIINYVTVRILMVFVVLQKYFESFFGLKLDSFYLLNRYPIMPGN